MNEKQQYLFILTSYAEVGANGVVVARGAETLAGETLRVAGHTVGVQHACGTKPWGHCNHIHIALYLVSLGIVLINKHANNKLLQKQ